MLLCWGANTHGQLGLGHCSEEEVVPRLLTPPSSGSRLVKIVGGGGHTLALDSAGHLFACGWNRFGQLGLSELTGDHVDRLCRVEDVSNICDLAAGWDFSLVVLRSGEVLGAGSNRYGQLGRSTELKKSTKFLKIEALKDIISISAGLRHAAAVDKFGHVFTWGAGTKGQLGLGLLTLPEVVHSPARVPGIETARSVACGQFFTLLTTSEGELWGFGDNKYGQLGDSSGHGRTVEPSARRLPFPGNECVGSISAGWTHACILLATSGKLLVWGRNNYFQCGRRGDAEPPFCDRIELSRAADLDLTAVKALAGSEHCLCLTDNGRVLAWGWNEHANCGQGGADVETVATPSPVALQESGSSSCRVLDIFTGSAHCFAVI